jgi:ABC-type molybdenum transport system ATPase subunit/photorepair protein PhrA
VEATITVDSPVAKTPRVLQMASMFDVPVDQKAFRTWHHKLPIEAKPWQVGLIVGPSGAGKTTLARQAFGDTIIDGFDWSPDRAIIDDFPEPLGIKDVTGHLTAVGLSSPRRGCGRSTPCRTGRRSGPRWRGRSPKTPTWW